MRGGDFISTDEATDGYGQSKAVIKHGHKIVVMAKHRQRRGGQVAAAAFKATCLKLMDRVRETGVEYVVTKHGTPVAKLVPYKALRRRGFGSMKGTVLAYERPFEPIEGDYEILPTEPCWYCLILMSGSGTCTARPAAWVGGHAHC